MNIDSVTLTNGKTIKNGKDADIFVWSDFRGITLHNISWTTDSNRKDYIPMHNIMRIEFHE